LAKDLYIEKLKTKSFRRWMKKKLDCENMLAGKKKSSAFVCRSLAKWAYLDVKIAFTEWRDCLKLFKQRA